MRARRWMFALAILLVAASPGPAFFELGPDVAIFPLQEIPILINHNYHVRKSEAGVEGENLRCKYCHTKIETQTQAGATDIPGAIVDDKPLHETCQTACHADACFDSVLQLTPEDNCPTRCAKCHIGAGSKAADDTVDAPAKKLTIPEPNIIFSHAVHTASAAADIQCEVCHTEVRQRETATRNDYPTMDRCIACHQERGASTECKTCHFTLPNTNGRLKTHYDSGVLRPKRFEVGAIHGGDFLRQHAVPAQRDKAYCEKCHTQNDCLKCHDGVGRDVRYHPGDWISTHPLRGKKDDFRCQSCHNFQQFCLNCHIRTGVASVGNLETMTSRRTVRVDGAGVANGPHPMAADGWIDRTSRNFHGVFAQRNIKSCASCHQEQFCLTCHASGYNPANPSSPTPGLGGNPHPPGFSAKTASTRTARACLKCHHPADPAWRK